MPAPTTARAYSNIALIKYWGNNDDALRLPANSSLSMNLAGLHTTTSVLFDASLKADQLTLDGEHTVGPALERVSTHLDRIRDLTGIETRAEVISDNSFPMGAGIASSASAFAALTLAACVATGLDLAERELSKMARLGSGSASRSVPGGFVQWHGGSDHDTSFAESIAPLEHWSLVDLIAIVSDAHKVVGSTAGHSLAASSPLQSARLSDAPRRFDTCRRALLERDFASLAEVVEDDALQMHAVMMTSRPSLIYWLPATLLVMSAVRQWREDGYQVCFTIDAGPNVHVLALAHQADEIETMLGELDGVSHVLKATVGGAAELVR